MSSLRYVQATATAALLLLLLAGSALTRDYPFTITTDLFDVRLRLAWNVDWNRQVVYFRVQVAAAGTPKAWRRPTDVLIGFSDHGMIAGSDFCLYRRFDTGAESMYDGWIDRHGALRVDMHQDCRLHRRNANTERDTFYFHRRFLTCDPRDYAFELGTTNVLLAVGYGRIMRINNITGVDGSRGDDAHQIYHRFRYTQILQHIEDVDDPPDAQATTLEVRTNGVAVLPEVTTYWCVGIELPTPLQRQKHHITRYEAVITKGLENIVHHFELFHCQRPIRPFASLCVDDHAKPVEARYCSKVIAAWAMGAAPIIYPKETGMPLGGEDFVPYLMIEIHYNNPERRSGLVDNSGIRITYTDQLRPYDAGILELGLIYSDANSIPPRQPAFPLTGYCVADCTKKFPRSGINVFATQLHAHLTGRKLFTSYFRNGVKIGEINRDNHYSPHWQHIQRLRNHIRILPGDVLTTTCVYETKNKHNWTWGGYGIEDEMCVNYIHYYPATDVEVCKSAVDNSTLYAFFRKLGVENEKLEIHQKYLAVKWTPAKINALRELYHVAPLNMACLAHSGEPFPGHPTRWQNVSRPDTSPGIYTRGRSADECFAIND